MIEEGKTAIGDDSRPTPVCHFDYAAVDQEVFGAEPESDLSHLSRKELEGGILAFRCLLQWIVKPGNKNMDGIGLRAATAGWIFLKEFRPLQLSELARAFGKDKQSFGRHVDDFKRTFPNIRTPHMRPLENE